MELKSNENVGLRRRNVPPTADNAADTETKCVKPDETVCADDFITTGIITVSSCDNFTCVEPAAINMSQDGCILDFKLTLTNLCPGRRAACAVVLQELDPRGCKYMRGCKTALVPAQSGPSSGNVTVCCMRFVLPAELDVGGSANNRRFVALCTANYIDAEMPSCNCDARA